MDTTGNSPKACSRSTAADEAAGAAKDGIRSAQKGRGNAADSVAGTVDQLRDRSAPALEKASAKTQEVGKKGKDALTDASGSIRDRAAKASDAAVACAQDEPMKALLIAAAAGALLVGLLVMVVRSSGERTHFGQHAHDAALGSKGRLHDERRAAWAEWGARQASRLPKSPALHIARDTLGRIE